MSEFTDKHISSVRCSPKKVCHDLDCPHLSIGLRISEGTDAYYCSLIHKDTELEVALIYTRAFKKNREECKPDTRNVYNYVPLKCPYILEHAMQESNNE